MKISVIPDKNSQKTRRKGLLKPDEGYLLTTYSVHIFNGEPNIRNKIKMFASPILFNWRFTQYYKECKRNKRHVACEGSKIAFTCRHYSFMIKTQRNRKKSPGTNK